MPAVLPPSIVAVTGANGFIGSHVVDALLNEGYQVVPVTRDPSNPEKTAHLDKLGEGLTKDGKPRSLLPGRSGDLLTEGAFDAAFKGVDAVIHTAAIVQMMAKKDGVKEIIDPSHKGTRNVLDAVAKAGTVKRIVHTSSVAAVMRYNESPDYIFTEKDEATWSSISNGDFYGVAKLGAERMVREECENKPYDAAYINPGLVLGPCMCKAHTKATPVFLRQMLFGNRQANPFITPVDVREVAQAHVAALFTEEASGERFILAKAGTQQNLSGLAVRLKELFPSDKVYTEAFFTPAMLFLSRYGASFALLILAAILFSLELGPSWLPKVAALLALPIALKLRGNEFSRAILSSKPQFNTEKSEKVLKIQYRSLDETLQETVDSMRPWVKIKKRTSSKKAK